MPEPSKEEKKLILLLWTLHLSLRKDGELTNNCDIRWWRIAYAAFPERVQQRAIDKGYIEADPSGVAVALTADGYIFAASHMGG